MRGNWLLRNRVRRNLARPTHDAGRALFRRVLSADEIRRQRAVFIGHIDRFDARAIVQRAEFVEALDRLAEHLRRLVVFRLTKMIGMLILRTSAQIVRRRGQRMAALLSEFGAAAIIFAFFVGAALLAWALSKL